MPSLLYPTGSFSHDKQRQLFVGSMMPLFLVSPFISSHMVYRASTFAIGLGLFGDPILTRVYYLFDLKNYRLDKYVSST